MTVMGKKKILLGCVEKTTVYSEIYNVLKGLF